MATTEVHKQKSLRRSRYRRDSSNPPPFQLTQRDLEVLKTVGDYQLLSAAQVQALHFRSLQKTRKRLFRLWQHGLLERRFGLAAMGQGTPPALYSLSQKGARILVTKAGLTIRASLSATPARKASPLFYEHTLRRNDFRIALTLACRSNPDLQLLFWKQDKSIKDMVTFLNGSNANPSVLRKVPVFADGFFGIEVKGNKRFFFVEVDRGTTAHGRLLLKLKAYHHLWLQRRHVQRFGIENFQVLYITSGKERLEHLIQSARKAQNGEGRGGLFRFTTFDRVSVSNPVSVLGPIWKRGQSNNGNDSTLLQ